MKGTQTAPPPRHTAAWLFVLAVLSLGGGIWLGRGPLARPAQSVAAPAKQLYTCGMHPQVVQDHPGDCPICGMALTPVRGSDTAAGSPLITIDPVTAQNMGVRTAIVATGALHRTLRTVATVEYDETSLADVTTKFRGWIEKLHVNATGQQVHRGDTLFEIYSPELYSAQTEYLLASRDTTGALAGMKASATTKLKYFDISDDQIAELQRTQQASKTLRITAPRDGIVVERNAVEGQMVDAGMNLYRIADLGLVWVQAQIFEQDTPFLRIGQEALVTLAYLPDRTFRGRVTFIYPTVDEKTRTARVRMEFHNPGYYLKPGMFATVELRAELAAQALLVPDTAILRSGARNTVFVALEGGRFEPREVTLGPRGADQHYQVLSGLAAGERIVTSGQFLLDSESQLRDAIAKMAPMPAPNGSAPPSAAPPPAAAPPTPPAAPSFVCPMPEHVAILYQHAGACPLCHMALVPADAGQRSQWPAVAEVDYYTCPMPEHAGVHARKPGKCPECGMTLIPVPKTPPPQPAAPPGAPPLPKLYTCPMIEDVEVVSSQPEKCRKCGMKLVDTATVAHGRAAEAIWKKQHEK